jgi:hypothetical protein
MKAVSPHLTTRLTEAPSVESELLVSFITNRLGIDAETPIGKLADSVFDVGRVTPIADFCIHTASLTAALRHADLEIPVNLYLVSGRDRKIYFGHLEAVQNFLSDRPGGDRSLLLVDESHNFLMAFNHSGAMSVCKMSSETADIPWADLTGVSMRTARGIEVVNVSSLPTSQVMSWLPQGLNAEQIVFLPDVCPSDAPLPTGTVVKTSDPQWRKFAISDCGCGMQLVKTSLSFRDFDRRAFDGVAEQIRANKGHLGDLGGGNHFLDALVGRDDRMLYFLIHTGSRSESGHVDKLVDSPDAFDRKFEEVFAWARSNRDTIRSVLDDFFGRTEMICDLPHNTIEAQRDGSTIIRKGAIKAEAGSLVVIPSSMSGDVVMATAKEKVGELLNSLSHGTGRLMPRSVAKELATQGSIASLRESIYIPDLIADESLRSEIPAAYRPLDECLGLLRPYIEEHSRLQVIGYIGHL